MSLDVAKLNSTPSIKVAVEERINVDCNYLWSRITMSNNL